MRRTGWNLSVAYQYRVVQLKQVLLQINAECIGSSLKLLAFFSGAIGTVNCTTENAFDRGCLRLLTTYIEDHAVSLGTAGVIVALIQVNGRT